MDISEEVAITLVRRANVVSNLIQNQDVLSAYSQRSAIEHAPSSGPERPAHMDISVGTSCRRLHGMGGTRRCGAVSNNVRFDDKRLATSNAELVRRVAELCAQHGRRPATAPEARSILSLAPG